MLEDMLWACVLDLKGSCEEQLPLMKFASNDSYQASIQMTPYEVLYERHVDLQFVGQRWERDPSRVRI